MHFPKSRVILLVVGMEVFLLSDLVTIIVPVYNSSAYIEKCISSIIAQTYKNLQIVIVNDGSTDDSGEICYRLAEHDNRITVLNKKNGGVSSARNMGLDVAKGKFIGFVDSDDNIEPEMFELLVREANYTNSDITEIGCRIIDANGLILKEIDLSNGSISGTNEILKSYLLYKNTTNYLCNKLFRSELFNGLRLKPYKYSEDYLALVELLSRSKHKTTIAGCYYNYLIHPLSATQATFAPGRMDGIMASEDAYNFIKKNYPDLTSYAASRILNYIFSTYESSLKYDCTHMSDYTEQMKLVFKKYSRYITSDMISDLGHKRYMRIKIFNLSPKLYLLYKHTKQKAKNWGIRHESK